jgi:hypothetical protein
MKQESKLKLRQENLYSPRFKIKQHYTLKPKYLNSVITTLSYSKLNTNKPGSG